MIRRLGASVLAFEAVVILLAIPVAINVYNSPTVPALLAGFGLILAAVLVAARLDRPWGIAAGWVVQVLVVASAIVVPVMGILGLIFAGLWFTALKLGAMAEEQRAELLAEQDSAGESADSTTEET